MVEEASVVEEVEIEAAGVASVEDLVVIEVDLQLVVGVEEEVGVAAEAVAVEPQKLL